jgi:hypothetical protein
MRLVNVGYARRFLTTLRNAAKTLDRGKSDFDQLTGDMRVYPGILLFLYQIFEKPKIAL